MKNNTNLCFGIFKCFSKIYKTKTTKIFVIIFDVYKKTNILEDIVSLVSFQFKNHSIVVHIFLKNSDFPLYNSITIM